MKDEGIRKAPIALFVYQRLDHTKKVVKALEANKESIDSELFIFIDGPKSKLEYEKSVEIENYCNTIEGFRNLHIFKADKNQGLSKAITNGVTQILEKHEETIVVEDDIVVSPSFLEFMNSGLEIYRLDDNVASIHGYVYPVNTQLPETFFIRGADCWGWATWRRAWEKFNSDGIYLLNKVQQSKDKEIFDFEGFGGFIKMLQDSTQGRNDSWAIKWYASAFLEEMHTLYPGKTLVNNIGFDGTGTHSGINKKVSNQKIGYDITIKKIKIEDNEKARKEFIKYFKSQKHSLLTKIIIKIRNVFDWYVND